MEIKRAYKFRFYSDSNQAELLTKTFGCARFIYNYMLSFRTVAWNEQKERISYNKTSLILTSLKKQPEYEWLKEVPSVPIQQSLRHLQAAFNNFYTKRAFYPSFRSKHGTQSAEYTKSAFSWNGKTLTLAKMNQPLAIRFSRTIPKAARVTTVTVSKDAAGRYFVSMLCDDAVSPLPKAENAIGIDLGLSNFATISNGEKISAPNSFRKHEKRLAKLQRRLSKKQKGSHNRTKARIKVAKLLARTADIRRDFLHKLSTRLIRENQTIAIETLAVKSMQKDRRLSKSIADASWSEFVRQLEYKAKWYGRKLIGIDK